MCEYTIATRTNFILTVRADGIKSDPISCEIVFYRNVDGVNVIVGRFRENEVIGWIINEVENA